MFRNKLLLLTILHILLVSNVFAFNENYSFEINAGTFYTEYKSNNFIGIGIEGAAGRKIFTEDINIAACLGFGGNQWDYFPDINFYDFYCEVSLKIFYIDIRTGYSLLVADDNSYNGQSSSEVNNHIFIGLRVPLSTSAGNSLYIEPYYREIFEENEFDSSVRMCGINLGVIGYDLF